MLAISPSSASSQDSITPTQSISQVEADIPISVIQANSYEGCIPTKPERAAIQIHPDTFLKEHFAKPNQSQLGERVRREIIPTKWWLNNEPEPPRFFHQYIRRVKSKMFECTACNKEVSFF
jgi:hypothetical protein